MCVLRNNINFSGRSHNVCLCACVDLLVTSFYCICRNLTLFPHILDCQAPLYPLAFTSKNLTVNSASTNGHYTHFPPCTHFNPQSTIWMMLDFCASQMRCWETTPRSGSAVFVFVFGFFLLVGTPLRCELRSPFNLCGVFYLLRSVSYSKTEVGYNWTSNVFRRGHLLEEILPLSPAHIKPEINPTLLLLEEFITVHTTSKPSSRKVQSYINTETKYVLLGFCVEGRVPLGQGQQLSRDVAACTVATVPFVCT